MRPVVRQTLQRSNLGIAARLQAAASPSRRGLFTATAARNAPNGDAVELEPKSGALNPRWLSDLRSRIKRSLSRCQSEQDASPLREQLERLDRQWVDLLAGREGFLTEPRWRGLNKHSVAWGDMVGHRKPGFNFNRCTG